MGLDTGAVVHGGVSDARIARASAWTHDRDSTRVAFVWLSALVMVAPFELREPLLRLPGQSISSVEVVLFAGLLLWLTTIAREGRLPSRKADIAAWGSVIAVAALASILSPVSPLNALHMTARLAFAGAVCLAAASAAGVARQRAALIAWMFASGVLVALVVLADFLDLQWMSMVLTGFRENVAIVGTQVRASGPFQYPTIASMFLEITFAIGLGLLASASTAAASALLVLALAVIGEAVIVTFTRSGLLVLLLSLAIVATYDWRSTGPGRSTVAFAVLAAAIGTGVLTSRSAEMLMLRLTTEGQGQWFSAVIDGPASVRLDTRDTIDVPLQVTNTGRATWDSDAAEPVRLSYHWIASDSDAVIAWEGYRTAFDRPVRPGETVSVVAKVGSTGRPGDFRLMWDLEQQRRLWFSTEPGAVLTLIPGRITGAPTGALPRMSGPRHIPRAATRPGRFVLWRGAIAMLAAHPLLGVGPDNYRLAYGRYTSLGAAADPRVHSNNMYLELLVGMGLIGAMAVTWLGLRLTRDAAAAWQSSPMGAAVGAACTGIAVHGLADSFLSFTGTYILIAVTLGLASACARDGHAHRI
jgi:O-antigen ligase